MSDLLLMKSADISSCGAYRYRLERRWSDGSLLPFVMLNPSTADADLDDRTIRRCIGFARRERAAGIAVVNLYAFRATNPRDLFSAAFPYGPDNFEAHRRILGEAKLLGAFIVCAWGMNAKPDDQRAFRQHAASYGVELRCLGKTKDGHPRHPLYVKADQPFELLQGSPPAEKEPEV